MLVLIDLGVAFVKQEKGLSSQLKPLWPYVKPHGALVMALIVFAFMQVGANLIVSRSMGWP